MSSDFNVPIINILWQVSVSISISISITSASASASALQPNKVSQLVLHQMVTGCRFTAADPRGMKMLEQVTVIFTQGAKVGDDEKIFKINRINRINRIKTILQ